MRTLKRFFASSATYFLGSGLNRTIPFFFLPLLTRWLSQADYGFIGTFNAFRTNVQPVISMGSSGAVNRAYIDRTKPHFDFRAYLFNAFAINFILFHGILILAFLFHGVIEEKFHFPLLWVLLVISISLFSVLSNFKLDLWVYQDRPWIFGLGHLLLSVLNIGLSLFCLKFFWMDWRGRIVGIVLAELLFCFVAIAFLWKEEGFHFRFRKDYIKDVLAFGLPLYPHSLGLMMMASADKFFLNALLGMEVLGVYAVGYTFASILHILIMPFDTASQPRIYNMLDKDDSNQKERFVCLFATYFLFFLLLSLFLSTWLPPLLQFFVGEKFHGAGGYILWLVLGQFFLLMYRIPAKWIGFAKKNYFFPLITFSSGLIAVGANYFFITWNGAIGAAQATLLAYLTMFALTALVAQRLYPMPWSSVFKFSAWRRVVLA